MKESIRLIRPFLRGLPLIVLSVILAVLIAKKYLTYVTPYYESTAKIKLADLNQGTPNSNLFKNLDVFASNNKVAAEIELIKSSVLLEKVILNLGFSQELYRLGGLVKQELYNDAPILITGYDLASYIDEPIQITIDDATNYTLYIASKKETVEGVLGDTAYLADGRILIELNTELLAKKSLDILGTYEYTELSDKKLLEKIKKNLDFFILRYYV